MSETVILIYKIATLLPGILLTYFAYNLFKKNIVNDSGSVAGSWGILRITFQNSPIGVIFLVAGMILIVISIWKGAESRTQTKQSSELKQDTTGLTISNIPNISDSISIDSMYSLGKKSLDRKQYLEAYKYMLLTKGISWKQKNSLTVETEIDLQLSLLTKILTKKLQNLITVSNLEETKSAKINDEMIDTSK
jgi:hypothetical protein